MAPKKKGNKHHPDGEVNTGGGKGRDQYGRKFGKKHASAMMEFTKTLWMQDATTSLRNILKNEVAQVTKDYRLKLNLRLHKPRIVIPIK